MRSGSYRPGDETVPWEKPLLQPQELEVDGPPSECVKCKLCGSDQFDIVYRDLTDRLQGLPGRWVLVRCNQCSLVFLNPRPTAAATSVFYPEQYIAFEDLTRRRGFVIQRAKRLRKIGRALVAAPYHLRFGVELLDWRPFGRGRVLDVGCGNGRVLESLRKNGWDVYGIDISARAVENARKLLETDHVLCGAIERTDIPWGDFDLVVLWHTLEHVRDPLETLRRVHDLLAPKGMLAVAVPNIASYESRIFRQYWRGLEIPRHFFHFNRHTLTSALAKTGFEVFRMRPQFCPTSFTDSLAFILEAIFVKGKPWHAGRRLLFGIFSVPVVLSYLVGNWAALEVHGRRCTTPSSSP